ncbi:QcrA and Rieske domain-containing protein [Mucilaginibacter auburnensis]|uniref:Cytochrome b6-f complex iron-sulfur subunit n=1 Tax=Mucilaginibacter auburnensis TaxID=1457233 RepID=A0A2H9VQN6_9SPHI|nr:Rieske 2Fe-2S domain-containing protein [Mucilaginibacter auburnensis]PJJ83125.1 cytochrome b6-f complex iron-sulfur subunit [Mucilaginibacter auburnensis]
MERDEFLSKLGIGVLALCTGCMASCGGKSSDPSPSGGGGGTPAPPSGSGTVFTADLNSEIKTIGASKSSNGVILVRIGADNVATSFTAVQIACTHEGTNINYSASDGKFICPLHGSQFSQAGAVLNGPAVVALKKYTVTISGTTLSVVA